MLEWLKIRLSKRQIIHTVDEGLGFAVKFGYPVVFVPSFSIKSEGVAAACNKDELRPLLKRALVLSPVNEVLIKKLKF